MPASLIANWKSELAKFAPSLSFAVAHPSEVNANAREIGLADADAFDLIVTTYGMLVRTDWMKTVSLAAGDSRRSPGDQELRHEADPGREGIDRRQSDRHDRHARRESAFGSLVALRFLEPRTAGNGQAIRLVRQAVARRRGSFVRTAAESRATLHSAAVEDRQAGDLRSPRQDGGESLLRAEQAPGGPLPESGRRSRRAVGGQPTESSGGGSSWPN